MHSNWKGKLSKNSKMNNELPASTYQCSLCGLEHERGTICPSIQQAFHRFLTPQYDISFIWSNIAWKCITEDVDYIALLREVENISQTMKESTYGTKMDFMQILVGWSAMRLNCSVSRLLSNRGINVSDFLKKEEITFNLFNTTNAYVSGPLLIRRIDMVKETGGCNGDLEFYIFKYVDTEKKKIWYEMQVVFGGFAAISSGQLVVRRGKVECNHYQRVVLLIEDSAVQGGIGDFFEENYLEYDDFTDTYYIGDNNSEQFIRKLTIATEEKRLQWRKLQREATKYSDEYYYFYCDYNDDEIRINRHKDFHEDTIEVETDEFQLNRLYKYNNDIDQQEDLLQHLILTIDHYINNYSDGYYVSFFPRRVKSLSYKDVIVRNNCLFCTTRSHSILTYTGIVPLLTKDSEVIEYKVLLGYCADCGRYVMYDTDFSIMLNHGQPLCQVLTKEELSQSFKNKNIIMAAKESLLYKMGYSVSKDNEVTEGKRHEILTTCVKNKVLTSYEIIDFLTWLINTRKTQEKYEVAVSKWEQDIVYIKENLMNSNGRKYIGSIQTKKKN